MPKLSRRDWLKTPYATSEARDPDGALLKLLKRYAVKNFELGEGTGPGGRPAVRLRLELGGVRYRFMLETLDAQAPEPDLLRQVKRALYFQLKSALELASVFFPLETALFAFRELADGVTTFEAALPVLSQLTGADFGRLILDPAHQLPAPQEPP